MDGSPLINKIPQDVRSQIPVSHFIGCNTKWNRTKLIEYLPSYIVDKTMDITIPMNDIQDKSRNRTFLMKSTIEETMIKFLHILKQIY